MAITTEIRCLGIQLGVKIEIVSKMPVGYDPKVN